MEATEEMVQLHVVAEAVVPEIVLAAAAAGVEME
jgi:hypothetical protein